MADYISREECIKDLREYEKTAFSGLTVIGCMSRIKRIPAADVRPMVRGKWIPQLTPYAVKNADICACSVCGDSVWIYKDKSQPWNFCPNCGADMREQGAEGGA